jgi:hypothetical protein
VIIALAVGVGFISAVYSIKFVQSNDWFDLTIAMMFLAVDLTLAVTR